MITNLVPRLQKELEKIAPTGMPVVISAPKNRIHSIFAGASAIACYPDFTDWSVSMSEWEEAGEQIFQKKCLN